MVLWSYMLGCVGPTLTAACAMTFKDPFVLPMHPAARKDAKAAKLALAQVSEESQRALAHAASEGRCGLPKGTMTSGEGAVGRFGCRGTKSKALTKIYEVASLARVVGVCFTLSSRRCRCFCMCGK